MKERPTPDSPAAGILSTLPEVMPGALVVWTLDGRVVAVNRCTTELLETDAAALIDAPVCRFWEDPESARDLVGDGIRRTECVWRTAGGTEMPVLVSTSRARAESGHAGLFVSIGVDLTERKQLEVELLHARKLESVGQLAAGIAHELNTPIQFVYDNAHFLAEAFEDLTVCVERYRAALAALQPALLPQPTWDGISAAEERADLDFLFAEIPDALARVKEGADRVAKIVRAMKVFAHPRDRVEPIDVNAEIDTTLVIARNEYKYVAEVTFERGALPHLGADAALLNQVFLNLIVNAAHAIADADRGRGRIHITTSFQDGEVVASFSDDGTGIPDAIRDRIFDPFFTTKAVGRGSGQGLSLVHQVVVERLRGRIEVESEQGRGTTITLRLPTQAPIGAEATF